MTPARPRAHTDSPANFDNVNLLFQYYQVLKQDLLMQTGSFKNHVRNSQIIGGALIAIITFLINSHRFDIRHDTIVIWLVVTATFTTVTYYLIYDVLEAVFAIRALEVCLSFLEERLNDILGANRLLWQSVVAQSLWPSAPRDLGFPPPMRCLEIYETVLVLGATVVLPSWVYYEVWTVVGDGSYVRHILVLLEIYSLVSAAVTMVVVLGVNGPFFRDKVRKMATEKWEQILSKDLKNNPA